MQTMNLVTAQKQYPGLDILKIIMALAVVAIHVKPFETDDVLTAIFKPCLDAAVPVFFLISAFLLFLKIERKEIIGGGENQWITVLKFIKRIGILYLVWFIIDSPYIILNKGYFRTMGVAETMVCFMKDLFLSSTFPGSWFLSALVVSVVVVYGLSLVMGKWLVLIISLLISIYIQGQELFPESWHSAYDWYASNIRKDVVCSFPFALVWVSIGQVLASLNVQNDKERILLPQGWLWCGLSVVDIIMVLTGSSFYWKYFLVVFLFDAFFRLNLANKPIYKEMRNASILVFLFHFSIAGKKSLFLDMLGVSGTVYHILYYLLVVVVSLLFAFAVLWLEKYQLFKWLRHTH